jgi:hypothetical protein
MQKFDHSIGFEKNAYFFRRKSTQIVIIASTLRFLHILNVQITCVLKLFSVEHGARDCAAAPGANLTIVSYKVATPTV